MKKEWKKELEAHDFGVKWSWRSFDLVLADFQKISLYPSRWFYLILYAYSHTMHILNYLEINKCDNV